MKQLLSNCEILTLKNGEFHLLKNSFLGIDNDTIDYIGTARPTAAYDSEKNLKGKLLTSGFINCHTHSAMVLMRGLGNDLPLQEWLFGRMIPIENKLTNEDIKAGTSLAILEMLASGTTSFSDMYLQPTIAAELVKESGMKANLCRVIQCFDADEKYEDSYRARESLEFFHQYNGYAEDRIRVDFAIHAEYTCFPQIVQAYSADCLSQAGRMHIHLSETKNERDACMKKYGKTPTQWFQELGTFDSPTAAAHCVWMTEEDLEILRDKHVSVIHNPTSNMKLGSGFSPVSRMLNMGINVTLGTDGAASNNNLNMLEEMHLASVIHKGYQNDPVVMSAPQLLKMATQNGALLQGRGDTGTLEVGKKADMVAFDLSKPHMRPHLDPCALLTYSAQGSDVAMTMVNGRILYENGEFLTMDTEKIFHDVESAVRRLYD